jgi:Clr5 domain
MEGTAFSACAGPAPPASSNDNDRWEHFRLTIERLYIEENRRLTEVVRVMKAEYGFDAVLVFPDLTKPNTIRTDLLMSQFYA